MIKRSLYIALGLALLTVWSCATTTTLPANYPAETECLGDNLDGTIRLRAWGSGLSKPDAIQRAQKQAIQEVLFRGITKGQGGCPVIPILTMPNARAKHAAYFDDFFADSGDYKTYVTVEKVTGMYNIAGQKQLVARVQLRVDVAQLKKAMQKLK